MLDLCLIANDPVLAREAEQAGVARVLIDLETIGKAERQHGKGLFLSAHGPKDVSRVRKALTRASLMVRTNPLHADSAAEIGQVIDRGADILMMPMAQSAIDARAYVSLVAGRARVSLLVETGAGLAALPELVRVAGVHEIHVGLNDLRLSLGYSSLFEPLCHRLLDRPAQLVRESGLRFGFGGVTAPSVEGLPVPPRLVIGEQVRLGSTLAWLGRSFRGRFESWTGAEPSRAAELARAVQEINRCVQTFDGASEEIWRDNQIEMIAALGLSNETETQGPFADQPDLRASRST